MVQNPTNTNKISGSWLRRIKALNQSTAEKRAGLMRVNAIVVREGEFFVEDEVRVGQALRVGWPLLFSF